MKALYFLLWLLLSITIANADTIKGVSAGIIPYACSSKGALYLLAYDPAPERKAWGAFGGRPKGMEPVKKTALREFREETNCIYDKETLENLILKGPSRSGNFYSYVAEVPFRDVHDIAAPRECSDVERSFWAWVPHDGLIRMLDKTEKSPSVEIDGKPKIKIDIWAYAAKSLRKALSDGFLNRRDPCKP